MEKGKWTMNVKQRQYAGCEPWEFGGERWKSTKEGKRRKIHFVRRPDISGGEPIIRGTRISVRHIVERVQAGQSVDDILAALPHLTATQVYDAHSYYYDHQPEIDRLIEESRTERVIAGQHLKAPS